jgi:translation initiation factor 6
MIIPNQVQTSKKRKLTEWFEMPTIETNIGGSVLLGPLVCANSNGIILPGYVLPEEVGVLKSLPDINLRVTDTRRTAYGNLVLTNDHGAIVDPRLRQHDLQMVSETLGVEVVKGEIAGLPYVGSLCTATNRGAMVHPLVKPEEEELLKDVLKVPVGLGTINRGIPYIAMGLIGNSKVAVAGSLTTGAELFMIGQALGVTD